MAAEVPEAMAVAMMMDHEVITEETPGHRRFPERGS
jgi:hypothetical protein